MRTIAEALADILRRSPYLEEAMGLGLLAAALGKDRGNVHGTLQTLVNVGAVVRVVVCADPEAESSPSRLMEIVRERGDVEAFSIHGDGAIRPIFTSPSRSSHRVHVFSLALQSWHQW